MGFWVRIRGVMSDVLDFGAGGVILLACRVERISVFPFCWWLALREPCAPAPQSSRYAGGGRASCPIWDREMGHFLVNKREGSLAGDKYDDYVAD